MSNTPHNHHYVPQHFQKAWAVDEAGLKIHRYKWIPQRKCIELSLNYSIARNASENDLYTVSDGDDQFEFETNIMTQKVDTPGSKYLQKILLSGMQSLTDDERVGLASYLTSLEARNPAVMQRMKLSDEQLTQMAKKLRNVSSEEATNECLALLKVINNGTKYGTGAVASAIFSSWGHGKFTNSFLSQRWIEVDSTSEGLITSNYPIGSMGHYEKDFLIGVALSPRKGLLLCPTGGGWEGFLRSFSEADLVRFLNLLTLYRATEAYAKHITDDGSQFVDQNLYWEHRVPREMHAKYLGTVMGD